MKPINQYVKHQSHNTGNHHHRNSPITAETILTFEPIEDVSPVVYDDLLLERGCHLEARRYDQ